MESKSIREQTEQKACSNPVLSVSFLHISGLVPVFVNLSGRNRLAGFLQVCREREGGGEGPVSLGDMILDLPVRVEADGRKSGTAHKVDNFLAQGASRQRLLEEAQELFSSASVHALIPASCMRHARCRGVEG